MEYDGNDYFGYKTEDEFRDWAVVQFNEHADVTVIDNSEMTYRMTEIESGGCCHDCYIEKVRVEVAYQGKVIVFEGYYMIEEENRFALKLEDWSFIRMFDL